jgi:hypothetical protein
MAKVALFFGSDVSFPEKIDENYLTLLVLLFRLSEYEAHPAQVRPYHEATSFHFAKMLREHLL